MKYFFLSIAICLVTLKSWVQVINLGSVSNFVVFSGTGALTNLGSSNFAGDVGTNTGAVNGFIGSAVCTLYISDAITQQATTDLWTAYNQIISIPVTNYIHSPTFGNGETLTTGVFLIASAGALAGNITLNGLGDTNALFIIRFDGAFDMAASSNVILINGAKPCNVHWVSQAFTAGSSSSIQGNFIAHNAAITINANANITGRLLSTCGAISIDNSICLIQNPGYPLPIELISFTDHCLSQNTVLRWSTASERNNDYFSLEKTLDGISWQIVATVDGAGNSNSMVNYSVVDDELNNSLSYYRLKQTDFDGVFEYSDIIAHYSCLPLALELFIYPNPTSTHINIQLPAITTEKIEILNLSGKIVQEFKTENIKFQNDIHFLENGIYTLRCNFDGEVINKRFIVQK